LSGNPLALAAGLAQLRELDRIDGWRLLEELGAQLEEVMQTTLDELKLPFPFHRIGSMFCLFFNDSAVTDLASAKRSNRDRFGKYFRHCLDHGVYFAPSQFEAGFLSTAHTAQDIERTATVTREAVLEAVSG
jgi:glutamate-1-semialdehyde 2,1-aminomutase